MPSMLIRALLGAGILSPAQAAAIDPQTPPCAAIERILQSGCIGGAALADFCADAFGHARVDLSRFDAARCPLDLIDAKLMQSHVLAPLAIEGKRLTVAISSPDNLQALDRIRLQTQLTVVPAIAEHDALLALIARLTGNRADTRHVFGNADAGNAAAAANPVDDAPVVRFLQNILDDAIGRRASDLHFEAFEKFCRIRFRIDGMLHEIAQPPLTIREQLASRIKVMSNLDIAEKRVPQDGRMRLADSGGRAVDCRVSTMPTLFGEKIVIRLLESGNTELGIDTLGLDTAQRTLLTEAIHRPHGMILATGPTGSGKTRSLYACLNLLNRPDVNISSAEDPAEIHLPGINQVSINERAGVTFPVALRAFLRQDPDIIMVGEIRDPETADIALKAAQTGHLVFSTLHTNDAASTLTRLANMGVPAFNIAASVILIMAQRLVRRLCDCKQRRAAPRDALLQAGLPETTQAADCVLFQPGGCECCKGSGYRGRIGIYQLLPITADIERLILSGCNTREIDAAARRQGMQGLRAAGLRKAIEGVTSLDEVLACTNPEPV
ncbi:type IV-A pilus assembly ATPase PilB [Oxalobacteraceae bacterium CAVE-383]|nr:type IV-A pilus assembly ATPase PilB [Oxalobacteraceae bacterium CAVE-383]